MDKKLPKDSTISKWKEKFPWLLVTDSGGDKNDLYNLKIAKRKAKADAPYKHDFYRWEFEF